MGNIGDALLQLGVGGIFAVLVIRSFVELVKAMKKNGGGASETERDIKAIAIDTNDKVKAMHSTIQKTDGDAVPMVYYPRSCIEQQKQIAKNVEKTAGHLKEVATAQAQMADTMREIKDKVS